MTEWTEPIRDVIVQVARASWCGFYASVTVDFEPAPTRELLVSADPHVDRTMYDVCLAAFGEGVHEAFGELDPGLPGVRVVLRRLRIHAVDSSERANRYVGRLAIDEWRRRLPAPSP